MNVTMAVRTFAPRGGAEKFSMHLAAFLRDRGHTVRVLALEGAPQPGIALDLVPQPRPVPRACRDWYTGGLLAAALNGVRDGLTWGEQKVWNAHVLRPGGGSERAYWEDHAQFSPAGRLLGPRVRHANPKGWFDLRAEANGYRHPRLRRVIVNAHGVARRLLADFPRLEQRMHVVHNGTRLPAPEVMERRATLRRQQRAACGFPADSVVVLFIGHGFRRKGLAWALRALARAVAMHPGLCLVVAGRDPAAPYLRRARALGLEGRVAFIGDCPATAEWFLAADVLLHPAHFDPFANVTVEALGYGVPVVTTRANGGHEILRHGVDGWIVDQARDVAGLARGVLSLLTPAARQAALETARAHTIERALAEVEGILQEVWEMERPRSGIRLTAAGGPRP